MEQASEIIRNPALTAKVAEIAADMCAQVCAETGIAPSFAKVAIQMPDDSVFEARLGLCPDGCGQSAVTLAVLLRL